MRTLILSLLAGSTLLTVSLLGISYWNSTSAVTAKKEEATLFTKVLDWTSFRGGDLLQGRADLSKPLTKPKLRWAKPLKGPIEGTAASVNGVVYVGTLDGVFYALSLKDGEQIWKKSIENVGFAASPLIYKGVVYVGDDFGTFHAFNAKDGKKLWEIQTDAEIYSPATTDGKNLLFGSYDGYLYCLDIKKREQRWKIETDGQLHSSPAIIDGKTFVTGCDQKLRIIDIQSGKEAGSMELGGHTAASPAILGDKIYIGTMSNQVLSVDWKKLEVEWRFEDQKRRFPFYASCAIGDSFVYAAGRDKTVHALDIKTGQRKWFYRTRARIESSPVYLSNSVIVAGGDGNLYLLDAEKGTNRWSYKSGSSFMASPAVARDRLLIGDEDGKFYCFDLVGGEKLETPKSIEPGKKSDKK